LKLIHVAKVFEGWLLLREVAPHRYQWFRGDVPTQVEALSIQEAMRLGWAAFQFEGFEPLRCGYKYTLPERDEHGTPALFWEMAESLKTPSGQYFDPAAGHNCIVHNIPPFAKSCLCKFKL
jgi:hypothetical protein